MMLYIKVIFRPNVSPMFPQINEPQKTQPCKLFQLVPLCIDLHIPNYCLSQKMKQIQSLHIEY